MAVTVFISYAHRDKRLRDRLASHLSMLRHNGLITDWDDGQLVPGEEWEPTILTRLNTAQLILLLISADFLDSDFCYHTEMKRALERHELGEAIVLPIILSPVHWQSSPLAKLEVLPSRAQPVTTWHLQDNAFVDITEGIERAITKLNHSQQSIETIQDIAIQTVFWNVPTRNPFFTGRDAVFPQLHDMLQTNQIAALSQPPAISGLGGVGKTQTAIEYAYRYRSEYPFVFWVRAASYEELVSDFNTIAKVLNIPEQNEQDQKLIVQAVKRWFESTSGWLLIFDNADDLALIAPHFPQDNKGHILLTTRATVMSGLAQKVSLDTMNYDEGVPLLLRRANMFNKEASLDTVSEAVRTQAQDIVTELGGLPLALDQAGAYIEETHISLSRYLELFRDNQEYRKKLLQHRGGLLSSHASVSTTIFLALQKIILDHPAAVALLEACAFLATDDIPEFIFTEGAVESDSPLQEIVQDAFTFNQALAALFKYSLIRRDPHTETFTVHRLIQVVIKDNMERELQHQWAERVVKAVNSVFPSGDFETWSRCQILLPHALNCVGLIAKWQLNLNESARLLNQIGYYLQDRGLYAKAQPLLEQALAIREQVVGRMNPDTAISLDNLAVLYNIQGEFKKAQPLLERALAIREQTLGPLHPDTASSLNSLAMLYKNQGQDKQALALYKRALAIREQVLGPLHPDTASSINNLATMYDDNDEDEEALVLYERALAICEQVLGHDHPSTARSLNNLAYLYEKQNKRAQALRLYKQALTIFEKCLGIEHPNTELVRSNYSMLEEDMRQA